MIERVYEPGDLARARAARLGPTGTAWLRGLPGLVARLEHRWGVEVVGPAGGEGSASVVLRVRAHDGTRAVIKLAVPDPDVDLAAEADTLDRADGDGYVRLLDTELLHGALLLEELGPSLGELAAPPEEQIAVLGELLTRAWRVPPPPGAVAPPGKDKATALHALVAGLWTQVGRPCPRHVIDLALACAERRAAAFDPARCVWVHGDPHPGNALRAAHRDSGSEPSYAFVDPAGFLAEPAYDAGVVLRDWCPQLLAAADPAASARRYAELIAAASGTDPEAVWEWGYLERVSTGLYVLAFGVAERARPFLETAELLGG